jgi:hypothetical protein
MIVQMMTGLASLAGQTAKRRLPDVLYSAACVYLLYRVLFDDDSWGSRFGGVSASFSPSLSSPPSVPGHKQDERSKGNRVSRLSASNTEFLVSSRFKKSALRSRLFRQKRRQSVTVLDAIPECDESKDGGHRC